MKLLSSIRETEDAASRLRNLRKIACGRKSKKLSSARKLSRRPATNMNRLTLITTFLSIFDMYVLGSCYNHSPTPLSQIAPINKRSRRTSPVSSKSPKTSSVTAANESARSKLSASSLSDLDDHWLYPTTMGRGEGRRAGNHLRSWTTASEISLSCVRRLYMRAFIG